MIALSWAEVPIIGLAVTAGSRSLVQMYGWAFVVFGWLSIVSSPAQAQSAPKPHQDRGRLEVQHSDDICGELSDEECCAQMLEIAVFRATGDQVPRRAKGPVRLSCKGSNRTIPDNACRLIAMGRGLNAREAADACAPSGLVKRCASDGTCRQCMDDLSKLEWKGAARACYALTFVPQVDVGAVRVLTLRRAGAR